MSIESLKYHSHLGNEFSKIIKYALGYLTITTISLSLFIACVWNSPFKDTSSPEFVNALLLALVCVSSPYILLHSDRIKTNTLLDVFVITDEFVLGYSLFMLIPFLFLDGNFDYILVVKLILILIVALEPLLFTVSIVYTFTKDWNVNHIYYVYFYQAHQITYADFLLIERYIERQHPDLFSVFNDLSEKDIITNKELAKVRAAGQEVIQDIKQSVHTQKQQETEQKSVLDNVLSRSIDLIISDLNAFTQPKSNEQDLSVHDKIQQKLDSI